MAEKRIYYHYATETATTPIDGPFTIVERTPGLVFLRNDDQLALLAIAQPDFDKYFRPKDES